MKLEPARIFREYEEGTLWKASLGKRGLLEQSRMNERFFTGDQWYGAKCGNERPLVRYNVIKRIGDYKMSQILSSPLSVVFSADGIASTDSPSTLGRLGAKKEIPFSGPRTEEEINQITNAFGNYYQVTAERVNLDALSERILRNSYISGTAVLYTYWDASLPTGLFADREKTVPIRGDINCEVLDIENVIFGDPYCEAVDNQPYIILSAYRDAESVCREAKTFGASDRELNAIQQDVQDGKVQVLTRLVREYLADGSYTIKCMKVTEHAVIRGEFDTRLKRYPIAVFPWERKSNRIYGESEITYLIPNQIAINRMITAGVWSAMTTGMPMMVVNGDTVTGKITNDPGQIIKVFGSNEDVAGAVSYVTPPSFSESFNQSVQSLIDNTLTQSGANEVALGDSRADNTSALLVMRDASLMPLQIVKKRFYAFIEEVARIWADFWLSCYGVRPIKIANGKNVWYMPFDASRYTDLILRTKVDVSTRTAYSEKDCLDTLITLYEKELISREQLLARLPEGTVPDKDGLLAAQVLKEDSHDGI